MNLKDWLQSSNSSESLQDLRLCASCSVPTTSAASRHMSKRKFADVNDLGVDDPRQVSLRAYPASMLRAKKRCFNAAWYQK